MEGQPIKIKGGLQYKIEQQSEWSMALGDEGSQFDHTDWKHHTIEWTKLDEDGKNGFRSLEISQMESAHFPKVTTDDIVKELKRIGAGKRWIKLARGCKSANSGACYVALSQIRFRVSALEDGKRKLLRQINFNIPMGC